MTVFRRFGLRFGLIYVLLYLLPFPLSLSPLPHDVPGVASLEISYGKLWGRFVGWLAHAIFHLNRSVAADPVFLNGDSTFGNLRVATILVIAGLIAFGWTLFVRRRSDDRLLTEMTRLALRYYLAGMMMNYGLAKFGYRQFPSSFALPEYMVERYGDSSPMRLLWAFMGYSPAYKAFTGIIETLSGTLLLFRRTTMLGALIGVAAIANVAMLDICYDVGLKLFTIHLLIFLMALVWPDRHRLVSIFIANRPTEPAQLTSPPSNRLFRISGAMLKVLIILGFVDMAIAWDKPVGYWFDRGSSSSTTPELEGAFDVQSFTRNGILIPQWTDPKRWQSVTFTPIFNTVGVHLANGATFFFHGVIDAPKGTFTIKQTRATFKAPDVSRTSPMVLNYVHASPDELALEGTVDDVHLTILLHRSDLLLLRRGFRWIDDEAPYNR